MPFVVWISVLALLSAIAPLATDMYLPAFPEMATELGTDASGVQLTLTAFLVGLAVGQLVIGPLSDGWGRRKLLLAGTAVCALAALAVAVAPGVEIAIAARFVQGFAGAAGIVLARAVIVDSTTGARTASLFAAMMAIGGIAPIVAPLLGSGLVGVIGWRGLFVVLAGLAAVMLVGVLVAVPETLPAERRRSGGVRRTLRDVGAVLRRRAYVAWTLTFALSFGALFAYISGSPFVLQDVLGLSSTGYATAFAANAAGIVLVSIVGGRIVRRTGPRRLATLGVGILVVVSAALLVLALVGAPRWPMLILLFVAVSSLGLVMGNASALAAEQVRDVAGTGSALLGALQFGLGAAVSPLVGASVVRMTAVMLVSAGLAAVALLVARAATSADTVSVDTATPAPTLAVPPPITTS